MSISAIYSDGNRQNCINFVIEQKKLNKNFKVIDVGGTMTGWSKDIIDALVDIQIPEKTNTKTFKINISDEDEWKDLNEYVKTNGKFDFSICTHTLEDISNPKLVCKQLSKISKAGYIAIPSKYIELSRLNDVGKEIMIDGRSFKGFIHHRYIFNIQNGNFFAYPKLNFLEADDYYNLFATTDANKQDLSFFWSDSIELNIINNDFIGPSSTHVVNMYRQGLSN